MTKGARLLKTKPSFEDGLRRLCALQLMGAHVPAIAIATALLKEAQRWLVVADGARELLERDLRRAERRLGRRTR